MELYDDLIKNHTVRPFIYKELTEYAAELGKEVSITDHLVFGGFPKRIEFDSRKAYSVKGFFNAGELITNLIHKRPAYHQGKQGDIFVYFLRLRHNNFFFGYGQSPKKKLQKRNAVKSISSVATDEEGSSLHPATF